MHEAILVIITIINKIVILTKTASSLHSAPLIEAEFPQALTVNQTKSWCLNNVVSIRKEGTTTVEEAETCVMYSLGLMCDSKPYRLIHMKKIMKKTNY